MASLPLNDQLDSSKYSEELEDNTIRHEMEGGYELTRARTTRRGRRTFSIGWTFLSQQQKTLIESFYYSVRGGSGIFQFTVPTTGEVINVRFQGKISFQYIGAGGVHYWNCHDAKLREV
ncbi:hypothetical protein [Chitinibacter tainanensis]|uniref:hypothetical protein n=1 Tax=Chitinibacter tainanensis TaxID=230667 RepID=UPI00048B3B76|nr:hypothetical protein [Chitinibacter tainanensis]